MVDRVRQAASACKGVLFVSLPMGKYASTEEVMELGENRECTIVLADSNFVGCKTNRIS